MYLDTLIVREDLRHKGIGGKLWKDLISRAGHNNICLDSVYESLQWYKAQGFIYESFKLHSYSTFVNNEMKDTFKSPYNVVHLSECLWPRLMEYDKQVFLDLDREQYLRISSCAAVAAVAMFNDSVVGFGFIHKKYDGVYGVRNVLADNETVFETLLRHLTAQIPEGSEIVYSLFDDKILPKYLTASCKFHGTTIRLYNKSVVKIQCEKLWLASVNSI